MKSLRDLNSRAVEKRKFWTLTAWAGASILAGLVLGILGFNQLSRSAIVSAVGPAVLYLFVGTQVILLGVVFYMYSLFESQKIEPSHVERAIDAYVRKLPTEDPRRQNVPRWKETRWRHLTPALFAVQSSIIILLLAWLSNEYVSNVYMQSWVQSRFPFLSIILDPYFVALLAGTFIGALLIHFLMRRSREERLLQYLQKLE